MVERVRAAAKPGDNVSDATRQEAMRALTASYAAIQMANAQHRNTAKRFQQLGVKTGITMRIIRDKYKDPADVLADLHEEIRQRALSNMPTVQQDLQNLWAPIDVPPDAQREHDLWRIRDAGAFAAREGQARDSNPHKAGSEEYTTWDKGWREDQTRIAKAMGKGEKPASASPDKPVRGAKAPRKAAAASGRKKSANGAHAAA